MTDTPQERARNGLNIAVRELKGIGFPAEDAMSEEQRRDKKAIDLLIEEIKDVRRRLGDVDDDLGG